MIEYLYLSVFLAFSFVIIMYIIWSETLSDKLKQPKYRLDDEGYLQFYYRKFNRWEYFPIWNENNEQRYVKVFDRIRNLEYTLSYIGPGRDKINFKYIFDDNTAITKDFITNYFRNTYPEFKNSEQLWSLHKLYINKENDILNNIVSDYTFAAHKINEKSN